MGKNWIGAGAGGFRIAVSAAALVCGLAASGAASAQELKIRAGVFVPARTAFGVPCQKFVDHVNETGKGQVSITLLGPDAVPPFELGNAVGSGVVDIACVPNGYYKGKMPEAEMLSITNIPFLEQRKSAAWSTLNKLHNEKVNAQYLAAYGDGVPFHFYLNRKIDKPEDFKGLKIRTAPNTHGLTTDLGATTVSTPPGELYTALERGTVEGYTWPLWGIHDMGWEKHTKYRVDPGFQIVAVSVLMNLPKYKGLTPQQKKVLDDAAIWLETNSPKWGAEVTAADLKKQADSGIQSINFGPAWGKRGNDVYFAEIEKKSPEGMRALRKLVVKE